MLRTASGSVCPVVGFALHQTEKVTIRHPVATALAALFHVLVKERPICVGVIDVSIGDQQEILLPVSSWNCVTVRRHLYGE
jgi:hypothetical protein